MSATFLVVAALAVLLPLRPGLATWLPLHLAMAGGVGVAVGTLLPFFTAALTATPPVDQRLRGGAIALLGGGATGVTTGLAGGVTELAVAGGLAYLAGLLAVGAATAHPYRRSLSLRGRLLLACAVIALGDVLVGVTLATLDLSGQPQVVAAWPYLEAAHAWLNVLGFLALVITSTSLHLLPTVLGERITPHRGLNVALIALAIGAPLVAAGEILTSDLLVRIGAAAVPVGSIGLAAYALACWRRRGHWTTDLGWHRLAGGRFLAGIAWFVVAASLAAARALGAGATPAAWALAPLIGPLFVGFVLQVLVGAWLHLVPAIGPGSADAHARQRRLLATAWPLRLGGLNLAALLLLVGLAIAPGASWSGTVTAAGAAVLVLAGLAEAAILVGAAWAVRAGPETGPSSRLAGPFDAGRTEPTNRH